MDQIINIPKLDKYITTFQVGQTLFLEGDDSQDLYILVEGKAGVLKGTKIIAEISEKGSIFGEMSFLLGENRTATVKALTDLKVIRIPRDEVSSFLNEFPDVVRQVAKHLAKRLNETSQIVYGLKEFCDRLPDAVILTDSEGKILSWNRAAEKLYGREEDQMRYRSAEEIYEDPAAYKQLLEELISKQSVSERVLRVRHPQEGIRHISTSTTVLYDGQHNFEGVISLGRDVTHAAMVVRRYERVRRLLIPLSFLLVLLVVGIFWGYPYFSRGYHINDVRKQELKEELAVDYRLLRSLVAGPIESRDRQKATEVMRSFFDAQRGVNIPFTGIVLLGKDKRVFDAYSPLPEFDARTIIGSSYSAIDVGDREEEPYKVLSLYREHKDHPMGIRHTEIAFRLYHQGRFQGWLIFQLDMNLVKEKYNADEQDIRAFRFEDFRKDAR